MRVWPLRGKERIWPDAPGQFGARRKHDIHTGVDLYCEVGTEVLAIEDGVVVGVERFTGAWVEEDPSPWWNDTEIVLVEGETGVFGYGEVGEVRVKVGERVKAGEVIAKVLVPVLKKEKGRPRVMLHLELYGGRGEGGSQTLWWPSGTPCPDRLLDPSPFLRGMAEREWGEASEEEGAEGPERKGRE